MGQVLAFAHCKESPSTASTTPDSTEGGNDESDFPELQTAREFSEDEEEASVEWGTPRELTFSYITIAGGPGVNPTTGENGSRGRRDSQARQARAVLPHTETGEMFMPALGDSLENIPSLCPSPEGEGASPPGHCQGLDPFSTWDVDTGYGNEAAAAEKGRGVDLSPQHRSIAAATAAAEGERGSPLSSSDASPEELPPPDALTPPPAEVAPFEASTTQPQTWTLMELCQHLVLEEGMEEEEEEEEEEEAGHEAVAEEHQADPDRLENTLEIG